MKKALLFKPIEIAFLIFIIAMIAYRIYFTESKGYVYLLWNLFLAWIPYQLSYTLHSLSTSKKIIEVVLFSTWLLFFPNALYIVTDLMHLNEEGLAPLWYDTILIFTVSITGLLMAFVSLFKIEMFLQRKFKPAIVNGLILCLLFLSSFGVYLGRFQRWNSWDIVSNPLQLLNEIVDRFLFPLQHSRTWGVTILFTCLFTLLYYAIKMIPDLLKNSYNINVKA